MLTCTVIVIMIFWLRFYFHKKHFLQFSFTSAFNYKNLKHRHGWGVPCHLAKPKQSNRNTPSSVSCGLSIMFSLLLFCQGCFFFCFCRVFLASCLPALLWGGASPPIHRSGWHRERRVHANLTPAHLIVLELIIKSGSEPIQHGLFWKETGAGRGRLPESWAITLSDIVVFTPHFEAPALPSGKSHNHNWVEGVKPDAYECENLCNIWRSSQQNPGSTKAQNFSALVHSSGAKHLFNR